MGGGPATVSARLALQVMEEVLARSMFAPDPDSSAAKMGGKLVMRKRQFQNLSAARRAVQQGRAALSISQGLIWRSRKTHGHTFNHRKR